ncbi:hypothetical protein ACLBKU_01315 [Erythrobacter sp. NE805]|uniref:hypothetical protein n=1 Tax=Erythrobacter sp. NE805 TaxID=3389875 RepID=UPI00396B25EC
MSRRRNSLIAAVAALALAGCDGASGDAAATGGAGEQRPKLGLMSSLPLTWPLGAEVGAIAAGTVETPWQGKALGQDYALVPLDTLAPIPGLSPSDPPTDPLAGLTRLAVIQPRGLSPRDNVALDDWVRAGGHLLLVLDPVLTGDYDLPLGDPRRPTEPALIPPVVKRWGFDITLPEDDSVAGNHRVDALPDGSPVPLAFPGLVSVTPALAGACLGHGSAGATCPVGKGRVTLIADAALFEHADIGGEGSPALRAVVRAAVE